MTFFDKGSPPIHKSEQEKRQDESNISNTKSTIFSQMINTIFSLQQRVARERYNEKDKDCSPNNTSFLTKDVPPFFPYRTSSKVAGGDDDGQQM